MEHDIPGYMCDIKKAEPYKHPLLKRETFFWGEFINILTQSLARPEREILTQVYVERIWHVPCSAARV